MIKIENVSVAGFEAAVRGMRNPLNSWAKSDSHVGLSGSKWKYDPGYIIGPADKELMVRLAKGGSVHAKYRRMITVYVDITAPLYWWKECDTHKVGTVANSCSTMHKIHAKEFTLNDFSHEHLITLDDGADNDVYDECSVFVSEIFDDYTDDIEHELMMEKNVTSAALPIDLLKGLIALLNNARQHYLDTKDKKFWWQMIQLLPSSYNQKRTLMLNYEVLSAMYRDRKDHKLDEWRDFCKWIESLPYSWIITGDVEEEREPLPDWPKNNPVFGPSDETKYFWCYVAKEVIPYDRSKIIVGWNKGSLWFEEEKVGDMMALDDIVPEGMIKLTYALKGGHEYLSGCKLGDFNFGFTVNPEEDELQLMLYRKE